MKNLLFLLSVILLANNCNGIKKIESYYQAPKSFSYKKTSKNFVPIDASTHVSKYEITNLEYNDFLSDLKRTDEERWKKCLRDSAQWYKKLTFSLNKYQEERYNWHPMFEDFPVVCIGLEQAKEFCKWKTDSYNQQDKKQFQKVRFRLPTLAEIQSIIKTVNIKYDSENIDDYDNVFEFNLQIDGSLPIDHFLYMGPVTSFPQNPQKVCSIIGNVCELTQEGSSTGGSWWCNSNEVNMISLYQAPDPRIGFRVVMEVLEN